MTPETVDRYLEVLKRHGVASARLIVDGGEVSVMFDVSPVPVGDPPQPGGWKSPIRLDDPAQLEPSLDEAP